SATRRSAPSASADTTCSLRSGKRSASQAKRSRTRSRMRGISPATRSRCPVVAITSGNARGSRLPGLPASSDMRPEPGSGHDADHLLVEHEPDVVRPHLDVAVVIEIARLEAGALHEVDEVGHLA